MIHIHRRVLLATVLSVGISASYIASLSAEQRPRSVCFPPTWGGIVAGITEDRDVVTLHGTSLYSTALGHGGGRYYSDSRRRMTMVVEIGVDNVIESVSIEWGQHWPSKRRAALPISSRIDIEEGFGTFRKLKLGSTEADVLGNLGEPTDIRTDSGGATRTWVYQTDYSNTECYADAEVSITFADGRVTRVVFYNGD